MFAIITDWLRRRAYRRFAYAAMHGDPIPRGPLPPTPEGWTIVPHATPGITAYEVSTILKHDREWPKAPGPGANDMCGLNATEYRGFPAETLEIGRVTVRHLMPSGDLRVTYRFDYDPRSRRPGCRMPCCDFHRLPIDQVVVPVATPVPATSPETAHASH